MLITPRKPRTHRIIGEARRLGLRNVRIDCSASSSPRLAAEFNGEPIIVSVALILADDVEYTNSRSRQPIASSRRISCMAHVPQARGAHQALVDYKALGEAVRTLRGHDAEGTEIAFDGFDR